MPTTFAGPAGQIEVRIDTPEAGAAPRAVVVLAHTHPLQGGNMRTKAVYHAAHGLVRAGCAVVRFNFRGVGASEGAWGEGTGEMDDFRAAIGFAAERFPGLPVWAAGYSFGAWIALEAGASDPRVTVLIGISPPVEREGYRFEHVFSSTKPTFLVQGGLDEIHSVKGLWTFYGRLPEPREMSVVDGASHLFEGRTPDLGDALEDLLADFRD